jgi:hypothetical protein
VRVRPGAGGFGDRDLLIGAAADPDGGTVEREALTRELRRVRREGHQERLRGRIEGRGRFWLNPGHTGLDAPGLAEWVAARQIRPIHLVHDLIPITHPQFCREGEARRHAQRMATVLDSAAGVVANSVHTLETLTDFAAARGRAVPPAAVAWPGTPVLPRVPPLEAPEPNFVILGTIEGRKNHALLLSLWKQMLVAGDSAAVPRLIIVGRRGWQATVRRRRYGSRAHLWSGVVGSRRSSWWRYWGWKRGGAIR